MAVGCSSCGGKVKYIRHFPQRLDAFGRPIVIGQEASEASALTPSGSGSGTNLGTILNPNVDDVLTILNSRPGAENLLAGFSRAVQDEITQVLSRFGYEAVPVSNLTPRPINQAGMTGLLLAYLIRNKNSNQGLPRKLGSGLDVVGVSPRPIGPPLSGPEPAASVPGGYVPDRPWADVLEFTPFVQDALSDPKWRGVNYSIRIAQGSSLQVTDMNRRVIGLLLPGTVVRVWQESLAVPGFKRIAVPPYPDTQYVPEEIFASDSDRGTKFTIENFTPELPAGRLMTARVNINVRSSPLSAYGNGNIIGVARLGHRMSVQEFLPNGWVRATLAQSTDGNGSLRLITGYLCNTCSDNPGSPYLLIGDVNLLNP